MYKTIYVRKVTKTNFTQGWVIVKEKNRNLSLCKQVVQITRRRETVHKNIPDSYIDPLFFLNESFSKIRPLSLYYIFIYLYVILTNNIIHDSSLFLLFYFPLFSYLSLKYSYLPQLSGTTVFSRVYTPLRFRGSILVQTVRVSWLSYGSVQRSCGTRSSPLGFFLVTVLGCPCSTSSIVLNLNQSHITFG